MSFLLGAIILPRPRELYREPIEKKASLECLDGTLKRDIINKKERFTLVYRMLTQAQVVSILSEYNQNQARNFTVSETNLTIAATPVHIDIGQRQYSYGSDYREDLVLTLTEEV